MSGSTGGATSISIDLTSCMGTGVCASLAPDQFSVVRGQAVWNGAAGPLDPDLVEEVVESCPMAAIASG